MERQKSYSARFLVGYYINRFQVRPDLQDMDLAISNVHTKCGGNFNSGSMGGVGHGRRRHKKRRGSDNSFKNNGNMAKQPLALVFRFIKNVMQLVLQNFNGNNGNKSNDDGKNVLHENKEDLNNWVRPPSVSGFEERGKNG